MYVFPILLLSNSHLLAIIEICLWEGIGVGKLTNFGNKLVNQLEMLNQNTHILFLRAN